MKIIVTGGSGFIGTNLVEKLSKDGMELINIDFDEPRNKEHRKFWKNVDITDAETLEKVVLSFQPDYIIHLAARTDLRGKTVDDYKANTVGVENMLRCCHQLSGLKKVLFTSSILVRRSGYQMKHVFDYNPGTAYGESKVVTEKIILNNPPKCDWDILRPTSIWGPWFGEPYRNFFDMIMSGRYMHIGRKSCLHTYGYVGNSIYQIEQILHLDTSKYEDKDRVFLLGDEPAYNIEEWANEIAKELGKKVPRVPFLMIKCAAWFGDFLKLFGLHFPMTSFRLAHMTTDSVKDISYTYSVAPNPPFTRQEGTHLTLEWLQSK